MSRTKKQLRILLIIASFLLIFAFIKTLYLLNIMPIYPDEIAIQLWQARMGFDFPMHVNIMPMGENFLTPMPLVWYIPGMVEWLLYAPISDLVTLRVAGILFYLIWIGMLVRYCVNKFTFYRASTMLGIVLSLVAIGVLPIFFITVRPEQIILFCLLVLFFLDQYSADTKRSALATLVVFTLFFGCLLWMLYVHPKTFYFAPFFYVVAYRIFHHQLARKYLVGIAALMTVVIVANLVAWRHELFYSPSVKAYMDSFNIQLMDLWMQPQLFYAQLKTSFLNENILFYKMQFQDFTDINYLPPLVLTWRERLMNIVLDINGGLLLFGTLGMVIFRYSKDLINKSFFSQTLLLLLVLVGVIIGNILNLTKTWYDVGYFWGVIILVAVILLSSSIERITNSFLGAGLAIYFMLTVVVSLALLYTDYAKVIVDGYEGPSVSIVHFNKHHYRSQNANAVEQCLTNHVLKENQYLVLDDYTYLYFKAAKNPLLITYVNNHSDQDEFPVLIKENKISAIITRCSYVSTSNGLNRTLLKQIGNVCCFSTDIIHKA